MIENVPSPKNSLSAQTPEHVFRPELPEERLKEVFKDHARIIAEEAKNRKEGGQGFLRIEDYWQDFTDALSSPEKWEELRTRIENEYPSLAYCTKQADIQQRLAEQIISDGKMTLAAINEKRRQYGSRQELLGLSGPEGLAAAYDLLSREGYEVYYPDPLLDALAKVDFIAYDQETESYYFLQIKTEDSLDEDPYFIASPSEVETALDDESSPLHKSMQDRPGSMGKLSRDLKTLSQFTDNCTKSYKEKFEPLYLILPSLNSMAHMRYCDPHTGLPKRDFPAIKLSVEAESNKEGQ